MGLFKDRKVSIWLPLLLIALTALAWLIASVTFKAVHTEEVPKLFSEIGIELFKTVFIGVCVGIGVEAYLKYVEHDASKNMLEKSVIARLEECNVNNVYPSREAAKNELKQLVADSRVKLIQIAGISLREFLRENDKMRPVWDAIWHRLEREESAGLADQQRLKVQLLLLDPRSSEGHFRYKVEAGSVGAFGKPHDIDQGLDEIERVKKKVYHGKNQNFFQVQLYGHCPFSFMFVTEPVLYIEQYYYREDPPGEVTPPLLEYHSPSPRYDLFKQSLDTIWKYAHEERIAVGTALPIEKAKIKNIYREDDREALGGRQVNCIEAVKGGTVDVLAISGRHYISSQDTFNALLKISSPKENQEFGTVRIALLNPISQQAIFRAVADDRPIGEIRDALCNWSWDKHKRSRLYRDINQSIDRLSVWKEKGHSFELRLYSSSVSCALLLTPGSMFIEQYIYGRTKKLQQRDVLIGEYPVFEYERAESEDKIEHEIISSTFNIVWDCYSVTYEEFVSRSNKEDEFKKNLDILWDELGCLVPTTPMGNGE